MVELSASANFRWNALAGLPNDWLPNMLKSGLHEGIFTLNEREMREAGEEEREFVMNSLCVVSFNPGTFAKSVDKPALLDDTVPSSCT